MSKFYRTIVTVEILSDEPIGSPTLDEINYQIMEGDWSGQYEVSSVAEISPAEISPAEMTSALIAQGSDPEFFGLTSSE
jgi:hypothetical protein